MSHAELTQLELLAEVDHWIDRLRRWADDAPAWEPAEKCQALVRRLAERAALLRVKIESPLVVATLGGTGTGKSSLINALAGAEIVQTGRSRPTTLRPTLLVRPGLKPEMLGIDPSSVEVIERDLPALRDLVLVDCPDPDTTEGAIAPSIEGGSNLARLRTILPKCDVLLVTSTQQKYRSARVADELMAAAPGARLVFVQTHADEDADIRDDWRKVLEKEIGGHEVKEAAGGRSPAVHETSLSSSGTTLPIVDPAQARIYWIDSLRALADQQNGLQPRGEFADLWDLLTRQMAGAAAQRIRRANFLDLAADTLDACSARVDEAMPGIRELQEAIDQQRSLLAGQMAGEMRTELLANRRSWENRLLAQSASRWGLSPFSLVLRLYQGIGGLLSGALLYRARTPAQIALWGALEGTRMWRNRRQSHQADQSIHRAVFDPAELRKAAIIVEGYAVEARLDRANARTETILAEAETAAGNFVARVASELDSLTVRLAKRHTGWFTRFFYESVLVAMLGVLLYRLGKNFFYDSWVADVPQPVFGAEFYLSAGFWLALWCMILLGMFCRRLRRGLYGEIDRLVASWQDPGMACGLFARIENDNRRVVEFRRELDVIRRDVDALQRQVAGG